MITLPASVTAAATEDLTGTATSARSTDSRSLPQTFLSELGSRLLAQNSQADTAQPLSALHASGTQAKSRLLNSDNDSTTAPQTSLTAFQTADSLHALISGAGDKTTGKSDDDRSQPLPAVTDSEAQNMQALFAMLPVPITPASPTASAVSQALTGTESRPLTLNNLAATTTATAVDTQPLTPADNSEDAPQAATATGAAPASSSASATAKTPDFSLTQIVSELSRKEEKNSAPAESSSLPTAAPLSSSSAPLPPQTTAAIANTPATSTLNAQLGTSEWQQALSQQIVMFSRNGQQNAELRLHPEDLGSIQISLTLDKDTAQISMASGHGHVRAALEAAIPQLRTALAENGIQLGQSQVNSDSSQSQSFQQQDTRRDGQYGRFSQALEDDGDTTAIAVPASLQARLTGNGAVDTFA